jgi:hypothetical protein
MRHMESMLFLLIALRCPASFDMPLRFGVINSSRAGVGQ